MVTPIPERQRECLRIIADYTDRAGFPPTIRDIATAMGLSSKRANNSVSEHLERLEKRGLIRRIPKISRGLVVTDDGRAELALTRPDDLGHSSANEPGHNPASQF